MATWICWACEPNVFNRLESTIEPRKLGQTTLVKTKNPSLCHCRWSPWSQWWRCPTASQEPGVTGSTTSSSSMTMALWTTSPSSHLGQSTISSLPEFEGWKVFVLNSSCQKWTWSMVPNTNICHIRNRMISHFSFHESVFVGSLLRNCGETCHWWLVGEYRNPWTGILTVLPVTIVSLWHLPTPHTMPLPLSASLHWWPFTSHFFTLSPSQTGFLTVHSQLTISRWHILRQQFLLSPTLPSLSYLVLSRHPHSSLKVLFCFQKWLLFQKICSALTWF